MSELALVILILVFGILILGNFACQIYVSKKIFGQEGGFQVVKGIIRGNRTFIKGWQQANELGIRDIMMFWSILVASLVFLIFGIVGMVKLNRPGPDQIPHRFTQETQPVGGSPEPGLPPGMIHIDDLRRTPGATIEITVALQPIEAGSPFAAGTIGAQPWPVNDIPPGTIATWEETIGKVAAVSIKPGQPILRSMLKDR